MEFIKKNWKNILIVLLVLFGMNKCTVSCNRGTTINKQQVELLHKDSVINLQKDSLKMFAIRWDENKKGQENYQNLATGTKQELTNIIGNMKNTIETMTHKIQSLTSENNQLKKENKQLKEQLNEK
jgi:peptidoglycan hydrolase CwlO-like protein